MNLPRSIASERSLKLLQFSTRALFALLVTLYFARHPELFKPLPGLVIWFFLVLYLGMQALLARSGTRRTEAPAAAMDLIPLAGLLVLDPGSPPPLLALIAVAVLSAGLIHGLRRFLYTLVAATLLVIPALWLRLEYWEQPPDAATLFLLAALIVCLLYFAMMLYRNQVLARMAEEATWQDAETGLLSQQALVHTAGWLLPLHDRLAGDLAVALLGVDSRTELLALTDRINQRLRRSDVAARFDEQTLAILLPCTRSEDAERLLSQLERHCPGLRGALLQVNAPDMALERILDHLRRTLARARSHDGHWLVHASRLSD